MALNFTKSDTEPKKARKYRDFIFIRYKNREYFPESKR